MFTTKVVRLTIKVNLVKKNFRKNRKKSDQNRIKWNKLELQLQSKNVYNKSCQACHESKHGWIFFGKNQKKSDQNGKKLNKLEIQVQSKNVCKGSFRLTMKAKTVDFFFSFEIEKNQIKMEKNWIIWSYSFNQNLLLKKVIRLIKVYLQSD